MNSLLKLKDYYVRSRNVAVTDNSYHDYWCHLAIAYTTAATLNVRNNQMNIAELRCGEIYTNDGMKQYQ